MVEIFGWVALAGILVFLWWTLRPKIKQGIITLPNSDYRYPYRLGDEMKRYSSRDYPYFSGIEIDLPKELPHIYLDGHKQDHRRGPNIYIDPKQKISLEGDFDKYFQAYIPKDQQVLALSILSPDVMLTVLNSAERYDVEIYGSHLRIISAKNVFNKTQREKELIKTAQIVLAEIAHRLKSWQKIDSDNAVKMSLLVFNSHLLKIGKYTLPVSNTPINISLICAGLAFYAMGAWAANDKHNQISDVARFIIVGFVFFPGSFIFLFINSKLSKRSSR